MHSMVQHWRFFIFFFVFLLFLYGIVLPYYLGTPLMSLNPWRDASIVLTEENAFDIVVYGEEVDGIVSAISAAKNNAKTLLLVGGNDIGGSIEASLDAHFTYHVDENDNLVNQGLFLEMFSALGEFYSIPQYKKLMHSYIKKERYLSVAYNTSLQDVSLENGNIKDLLILQNGKPARIVGKMFIDATPDGTLLQKCDIPFSVGAEDLHLNTRFSALQYNFALSDVNSFEISKIFSIENRALVLQLLQRYTPRYPNTKIQNFNISYQQNQEAIIQCLEIHGLNLNDPKEYQRGLTQAKEEAQRLHAYLAKTFPTSFEKTKLMQLADDFIIPEKYHFEGAYTLRVSDIFENRDFIDKISVATGPIYGTQFSKQHQPMIIANPTMYGIPLGCIVTPRITNLLMTGKKASFSSIVSTSVGADSVLVSIAEAAGILASFSIKNDISPHLLSIDTNPDLLLSLNKKLQSYTLYLPAIQVDNPFSTRYSYPQMRQLLALGLLTGGMENTFYWEDTAKQKDLVSILTNGAYRMGKSQTSFAISSLLAKYDTNEPLQKETAAKMISIALQTETPPGKAYETLLSMQHITPQMHQKYQNKAILSYEDLYDWSVRTLETLTSVPLPN